jgi:hypothetical protein
MPNGPNNPMGVNRMQGNMGGNVQQHQQAVRKEKIKLLKSEKINFCPSLG